MKLHQKVAIGIVMASSLVSCVGHQDQENLSTKSPVITSPSPRNTIIIQSREFSDQYFVDKVAQDVIHQSQSSHNPKDTTLVVPTDCSPSGFKGFSIDLSYPILIQNGVYNWATLASYVTAQIRIQAEIQHKTAVLGISYIVHRDNSHAYGLEFYAWRESTLDNCTAFFPPEDYPMNQLLLLTQSSGAHLMY